MQPQIDSFKVDVKDCFHASQFACLKQQQLTNEMLNLLLMFLEADICNSLHSNQNVKDGLVTSSREASSTTGRNLLPLYITAATCHSRLDSDFTLMHGSLCMSSRLCLDFSLQAENVCTSTPSDSSSPCNHLVSFDFFTSAFQRLFFPSEIITPRKTAFIKYSEAMLISRMRKEKELSFYAFHSRKQNEIYCNPGIGRYQSKVLNSINLQSTIFPTGLSSLS